MPYMLIGKIIGVLVLVGALYGLYAEYISLKEFKVAAQIRIAEQDNIIDSKNDEIELITEINREKTRLRRRANEEITAARIEAEKVKRQNDVKKLERVSNLENKFSKGSERLTRRAANATKKLFEEIENSSDLSPSS